MSNSQCDPQYFAILAMRGGQVQPLSLRTSYRFDEVKSKVQEHWPGVSKIQVFWHGIRKWSQLTDKNCQVTLELLKQRNGIDHLDVDTW